MVHGRVVAIALLASLLSLPAVVRAGDPQDPARGEAPNSGGDGRVQWLTAYHFHLTAASIRTVDPRFNWDAHFGGDLDLVDYRFGRINMVADYGVVIGSQFRAIDPNQGVYHLNLSASVRPGGVPSFTDAAAWAVEVQALFDHVSRHLSDRADRIPISWNSADVMATAGRQAGRTRTTLSARVGKVVQAAFVDYTWRLQAGGSSEYMLSNRAALIGRAEISPVLVDKQIAGRGTQVGATLEGGVRLSGVAAGVELFAAFERRVDPYPLERGTRNWALVGFRLVSR